MKKMILLFLLLIASAFPQGLKLKISLEKSEYILGEAVEVLVEVKNTGPDVLVENLNFEGSNSPFSVVLTDRIGKKMPPSFRYNRASVLFISPKILKQDSSLFRIFPLSSYYGNNKDGRSIIGSWYYFLTGMYNLNFSCKFFTYRQVVVDGDENWQRVEGSEKIVLSNNLSFTVVSPVLVTDKEIYDTLKKFQVDELRCDFSERELCLKKFRESLRRFIKDYPNSKYIEIMYYNLLYTEDMLKNRLEMVRVQDEFLAKYPRAWSASWIINRLVGISESEDTSIKKPLTEVIGKYRNTAAMRLLLKTTPPNKTLNEILKGAK